MYYKKGYRKLQKSNENICITINSCGELRKPVKRIYYIELEAETNENQPIRSNELQWKETKSKKHMKKNENQRIYTKRNVFQQKLTNKYKIQYNITKNQRKITPWHFWYKVIFYFWLNKYF